MRFVTYRGEEVVLKKVWRNLKGARQDKRDAVSGWTRCNCKAIEPRHDISGTRGVPELDNNHLESTIYNN